MDIIHYYLQDRNSNDSGCGGFQEPILEIRPTDR